MTRAKIKSVETHICTNDAPGEDTFRVRKGLCYSQEVKGYIIKCTFHSILHVRTYPMSRKYVAFWIQFQKQLHRKQYTHRMNTTILEAMMYRDRCY